MDALIAIAVGVIVLVGLAALGLHALGVGEHFLDPSGLVVVLVSRSVRAANHRRARKHPLPPGVPPPPASLW